MTEQNEWDNPKPKRSHNRLVFSTLLILVLTLSSVIVYQTMATPSPSITRVLTTGSIGPCTWFVSIDGTTPVAEAMVGGLSVSPGDNVVGTAGQDPAAFIVSVLSAGQAVCLSAQTFLVQSPIAVNVNNVALKGSGWATVIKAAVNYARVGTYGPISGMIENTQQSTAGVQNVTISDLSIDGNKAARVFLADDEGIRFDGAVSSLNRNINVNNVYVHDVYGTCINFRYVDGYTVSNSLVEHCSTAGQGGIYHGIYTLRSSNGHIISDNARSMLDGSGFKIGLGDFNTEVTNDNSINNAKDGFEFSGTAAFADIVHDVTLASLVSANNTQEGFDLNVGGGDNRFSMSSITSVFNVHNGIVMNNMANSTITGCTMMNNAFGGTGWQGIRIFSSTHIVISGCRSGDSQASKSQAYGVLVSTSSYISVFDTDVSGNLGLPVIDGGGNVNSTIFFRNDVGFTPEGHVGNFRSGTTIDPFGTASTVSASTTYTIGWSDCFITSTGGTSVSITISDPSGTQVAAGLTTLTDQFIPVGYKINWGAFSPGPTVNVYFN